MVFPTPRPPTATKIQPVGCLQIKLAGTQPFLFLCTSSPGRSETFLATKPMRFTAGPLQRKQLTLFSVLARVPLPTRTLSPSLSGRTTSTHPSTPAGPPQSPEHPLHGLSPGVTRFAHLLTPTREERPRHIIITTPDPTARLTRRKVLNTDL